MCYKPLRKDLTEAIRVCPFCNHPLRSLKAYVLKHAENNELVYAGPICARNNLCPEVTLVGIPDFTKFTIVQENDEHGNGGGGNGGHHNNADNARKIALEYIELRENKLVDIVGSYEILRNYYNQSLTHNLSDEVIRHIVNIEAKAPNELKLVNLQRCYNYLFWINVAIERLDMEQRDFLNGIKKHLIRHKTITGTQKEAVNKWLENIDGVPRLV